MLKMSEKEFLSLSDKDRAKTLKYMALGIIKYTGNGGK